MPGSFCSCSTSRDERFGKRQSSRAGDLQPAHHALHLLTELLVDLPVRVVDRRDDQVLQHLHVVFRDDFGIDLDRLQLLVAADDDGHHAAAGGRLDAQLGHLLLQALLHLLRLLHHGLDVHNRLRVLALHLFYVPDFRGEHIEHRLHRGRRHRFRLQVALFSAAHPGIRDSRAIGIRRGRSGGTAAPSSEVTGIFRPATRSPAASSHAFC